MEVSDDHLSSTSYLHQIATIYKQTKTTQTETNSKIQLYIKDGVIKAFTDKKLAEQQKFKKLDRKIVYKQINKELKGNIDPKIVRTAAKALVLFPWEKQFDLQKIAGVIPFLKSTISPSKAQAIDKMLNRLEAVSRSEEGGTGVIYVDCATLENGKEPYSGHMVIKFVNEARAVIGADRLLQALGFITPKSCYLHLDIPLKQKLIDTVQTNMKSFHPDLHPLIEKQTKTSRCILMMDHLDKAVSLRHLPPDRLLALLQNENFLKQLGKMIIIDTLINNTDRLNTNSCNLGNMMINEKDQLVLVDHEINIQQNDIEKIKMNLLELLKGNKTDAILLNLSGACEHDRKKLGGIALKQDQLNSMKPFLEAGIREGALEIAHLFSNPQNFNQVFQPYLDESEKLNLAVIANLITFIQKSGTQ